MYRFGSECISAQVCFSVDRRNAMHRDVLLLQDWMSACSNFMSWGGWIGIVNREDIQHAARMQHYKSAGIYCVIEGSTLSSFYILKLILNRLVEPTTTIRCDLHQASCWLTGFWTLVVSFHMIEADALKRGFYLFTTLLEFDWDNFDSNVPSLLSPSARVT